MIRAHLLYFKHLLKHKYFVGRECFKYKLYWQGLIHDWSKFLPSEWLDYVERFYGHDKILEKDNPKFQKAWLLHQHRNPHHWQYWILKNDNGTLIPLEMPLKYVLEMYCDWIGAGLAITGKNDVYEWYGKNKELVLLHPNTRKLIESLIYGSYE